jgi:hypothetical protein
MAFRIEEKFPGDEAVKKIFSEDAPLYSSAFWIRLYEGDGSFRIFLIYAGNDPVGGFYLYRSNKAGGRIFTNPPFSPVNGWILCHEKKEGYLKNTFMKEAGEAWVNFVKKELQPLMLITSFPLSWQWIFPFEVNGMVCRPSHTYLLNLSSFSGSGKDFLERMSLKVRKSVRLSEQEFFFEKNVAPDVLVDLWQKTLQRKGKNPRTDIPRRILTLASDKNSFSRVAFHRDTGKPVAFSFCMHDQQTCYALFNGYDASLPSSQTVKACLYLCIEEAASRNLQWFDFEGSMIPEVEKSYREFGGNPGIYFYVSYCPAWIRPAAAIFYPQYF